MKLTSITLENFRNYDSLEVDLSSFHSIALVGENAQGKTNFLEGIAFLALGKSFKTTAFLESLGWERPHGRIRGKVQKGKNEVELEVFFQRDPQTKKVKKNSLVTTPADFLGSFRVVLFTPDTLLIASGSPAIRRQFFDRLLIQLDKDYVDAFSNYQRVLKQRNTLLKRIQSGQAQLWELDLWDLALAIEAKRIWSTRSQFMKFLDSVVGKIYMDIAGTNDELKIEYKTGSEKIESTLAHSRESDIRFGHTSVGPHRDDFTLMLNGHQLAEVGSRGECRSAILALKIAEIKYMEEMTGEKPLLLLDDVFSELDAIRHTKLEKLLKNYHSVITTTSADHISKMTQIHVINVEDGKFI